MAEERPHWNADAAVLEADLAAYRVHVANNPVVLREKLDRLQSLAAGKLRSHRKARIQAHLRAAVHRKYWRQHPLPPQWTHHP